MTRLVDVAGMKFGRLTVVSRSDKKPAGGVFWNCLCDCGNMTTATSYKMKIGHTSSCGCYRKDLIETGMNTSHGLARSEKKTYKTWKEMRQRCNNPNSDKFKWYGGRGISIEKRWDDFALFFKDMGRRPEGKTLDRIDNDGNYNPDNCQWITPIEQTRKQPKHRLNMEIAKSIRVEHASGATPKMLGEKYGVQAQTILNCIKYKSWYEVAC